MYTNTKGKGMITCGSAVYRPMLWWPKPWWPQGIPWLPQQWKIHIHGKFTATRSSENILWLSWLWPSWSLFVAVMVCGRQCWTLYYISMCTGGRLNPRSVLWSLKWQLIGMSCWHLQAAVHYVAIHCPHQHILLPQSITLWYYNYNYFNYNNNPDNNN